MSKKLSSFIQSIQGVDRKKGKASGAGAGGDRGKQGNAGKRKGSPRKNKYSHEVSDRDTESLVREHLDRINDIDQQGSNFGQHPRLNLETPRAGVIQQGSNLAHKTQFNLETSRTQSGLQEHYDTQQGQPNSGPQQTEVERNGGSRPRIGQEHYDSQLDQFSEGYSKSGIEQRQQTMPPNTQLNRTHWNIDNSNKRPEMRIQGRRASYDGIIVDRQNARESVVPPRRGGTGDLSRPSRRAEIEVVGDEGNSKEVLQRIYQLLVWKKIEHPSILSKCEIIRPLVLANIEVALNSVVLAYESLYRNVHDLEASLVDMEAKYKSKAQSNAELEQTTKNFNDRILTLEREIWTNEGKLAFVENERRRLIDELKITQEKHQSDQIRLENDHQNQVQRLNGQITQVKNNCGTELAEAQRGFEAQLFQVQGTLASTISQHEHWKIQMNDKLLQQREEQRREKSAFDETLRSQRANFDDERSKLRIAYESEKKAAVRGLQETAEALKEALVDRDHFKAMSDREFANRFQVISSEVDDLARVDWEKERERSWPFAAGLLRKSDNPRRTKQYVIQNSLWVILYEKIFCTPFRVLGKQGRLLEGQWIDTFGRDRNATGSKALCPFPTKASETWRFEMMKTCVEATTQPLREGDPNYNLKRDYELRIGEVTEELSQEIGRVALVSDGDKQRVRDLVEVAAKLWLEAGQQRCRMFLLMSDSGAEPARSEPTAVRRDGALALVVVPELRRMGNVKGESLERDEVVMGWTGKFSSFRAT